MLTMTAEAQAKSTNDKAENTAVEPTVEEPVKADVTLPPVAEIKAVAEEPPKTAIEEAPIVAVADEPAPAPVAKKRFSIKAMWQDIVNKVKG